MEKQRSISATGFVRLLMNVLALETVFLAYFGPDVVMPLGSAVAAGIGVILMFWHRGVRIVRNVSTRFTGTRTGRQRERAE
jgi:hypothetical protein